MAYEFTFTPRFQKHFKTVLIVEAAYLKGDMPFSYIHFYVINLLQRRILCFLHPVYNRRLKIYQNFFMRIWKC